MNRNYFNDLNNKYKNNIINKSKCNGCSENIKTLLVYDEKTVRSINDFYFPAPIGVSIDKNGVVNSKISFELIDPLNLISTIKDNLIISQGLLHLKLTINNPEPCLCSDLKKEICTELYIPIQNILANNSVCNDLPNEIYTTNDVTSFSVFGFPDAENHRIGEKIILIIKVIVDIHYQFMKIKSHYDK